MTPRPPARFETRVTGRTDRRAIAQSAVGVEPEINPSLDDIVERYQRFAVALVR
jgi:hypothetical protein